MCTKYDFFLPLKTFYHEPTKNISKTTKLSIFSNILWYGCQKALQLSSVAQLCPTLCEPMNRRLPGLPVHHQLPSIVSVIHPAISSFVIPFSSCPQFLPASESFPMSQLFAWGGQSTGVWPQHDSLQRKPRADVLHNGVVGSPCSPRDSHESSPTAQFKSINSSALSFLHSPTLTSIHDHWKNHSLE